MLLGGSDCLVNRTSVGGIGVAVLQANILLVMKDICREEGMFPLNRRASGGGMTEVEVAPVELAGQREQGAKSRV